MEPRCPKTISFPIELFREIAWFCDKENPDRRFTTFTGTVIEMVRVGLFVYRQEGKVESGELVKEIDDLNTADAMLKFLMGLTPERWAGFEQIRKIAERKREEVVQKRLA